MFGRFCFRSLLPMTRLYHNLPKSTAPRTSPVRGAAFFFSSFQPLASSLHYANAVTFGKCVTPALARRRKCRFSDLLHRVLVVFQLPVVIGLVGHHTCTFRQAQGRLCNCASCNCTLVTFTFAPHA